MTKHSRLSSNNQEFQSKTSSSASRPPLPNNHPGEIILFNFPESVFGRRIVRYLNFRQLPFSQIRVPPNMPRPILQERLGINYRRIPIMAIGRDVYIDTRLMLRKLEEEEWFPDGKLGRKDSFGKGVEDLLEGFVIDGGPFWRTAGCIPLSAPFMRDAVWMRDRFEGSGGAFTVEKVREDRSWCLSQLRLYFGILERMLADGRLWVLGEGEGEGEGVGMAEIHAGWVFDWAVNMAGDMDADAGDEDGDGEDMRRALSEGEFPKVHAWVRRFRDAADEAERRNPGAGEIEEGKEAEDDVVERILGSESSEVNDLPFDMDDVLGLRKGQRVSVAPVDFGFTHKDEGTLVGLSKNEVVIEVDVPGGRGKLRLHYPRIQFKILPA